MSLKFIFPSREMLIKIWAKHKMKNLFKMDKIQHEPSRNIQVKPAVRASSNNIYEPSHRNG